MRMSTGTAPMMNPRTKLDMRVTILVSFAAGILLGVPLTFGALFLGTLSNPEPATRQPIDERWLPNKSVLEAISPHHQTIGGEPGRPAATRLTNIRKKSGLERAQTIFHRPSGGASRLRGRTRNVIPSHASDFRPGSIGQNLPAFGDSSDLAPLQQHSFGNFVQGIFWTNLAESFVPKGFGEEDARRWRRFLNATQVLRVEEGCGRMQNRLVTLSEGRMSCCRYRHNNDQIQGEIFSFYLGRLLKIDNLSPSALSLVDPRTRKWSAAAPQMALALWSAERPAVLTQFVENLQPAFVPKHFRDSKKRRLHPIKEDLQNLTLPEISELVQWSDLVIFDYLTANLDRVVNNMYNEQWNPGMMSQPTHNLAKTPEGLLLFLDNESGLLHGYRLLEKYEHYHRSLLDVLCLFRKKTIRAIEALHRDNNIDLLLKQSFQKSDPGMADWLPFLPDRSIRTLKERISQVLQQVQRCRSRFGPGAPLTDR